LIRFVLVVLLLAITMPAEAKKCLRYEGGTKHWYECSEPEKNYRTQWKTETTRRKSDGKVIKKRIQARSVCYNYEKGSIDYRGCRRKAKELFDDKCKELRSKYKKTIQPYNKEFQVDMEMYCRAEADM